MLHQILPDADLWGRGVTAAPFLAVRSGRGGGRVSVSRQFQRLGRQNTNAVVETAVVAAAGREQARLRHLNEKIRRFLKKRKAY